MRLAPKFLKTYTARLKPHGRIARRAARALVRFIVKTVKGNK